MARINLLPWREEFRQEKKKDFITHLVAALIVAAVLAVGWIFLVDGSIAYQDERNNKLKNEIQKLSDQVTEIQELKKQRRELLDRMRVIQELQGTRPVIVQYFDQFAKSIPDGIFVTRLVRQESVLKIEGVSESNNRVSSFMRNLDASAYFSAPNLLDVDSAPSEGDEYSRFSMELVLTAPGEQEKEN